MVEVVLVLVIVAAGLIFVSKTKVQAAPREMSDEALATRLATERAWVERYLSSSAEERAGQELARQYDEKRRFVEALERELASRSKGKPQG